MNMKKIKNFIFGNVNHENKNKKTLQNPYVSGAEGRREWNDRYLNQANEIQHWKKAFFASCVVSILLACVVAKIATESHIKPYVVETTQGMPYAIKSVQDISSKDQLLVNYAINQFIINAKSIVDDTDAEKALLNKVYAFAANNTLGYLRDYYQKNNPMVLASQYTVNVKIINSMPISTNTWQIIWDETKRNTSSNAVINTTRWMADVTYQFGEVKPAFMNENPFGIYITNITWSPSQV